MEGKSIEDCLFHHKVCPSLALLQCLITLTICSEIHKLIYSIWNKEELPEQWKGSTLYLSVRRAIKHTVVITEAYHF